MERVEAADRQQQRMTLRSLQRSRWRTMKAAHAILVSESLPSSSEHSSASRWTSSPSPGSVLQTFRGRPGRPFEALSVSGFGCCFSGACGLLCLVLTSAAPVEAVEEAVVE